jgi:transcriptional regulator with XRE-family HTH domain
MEESIGTRLKQARESRRLTLQQVSETTKVRPHYLQALENDDLSAISSAAQARGFLRIYAEFLGLNAADLMQVKGHHPVESTPESSTSTSDQPLVSVQAEPSKSTSEHPGVLANLLNRFTRPSVKKTDILQEPNTTTQVEIPATPKPQPFVPARVTEELPIAPEIKVEVPVSTLKPLESGPIPATEAVPTVKISKKTGSKPRKTTPRTEKQNDVKKKVNE